ncbi:hypothetical protein JCM19000A_42900 [Silvimonas sp. JCM 19000]
MTFVGKKAIDAGLPVNKPVKVDGYKVIRQNEAKPVAKAAGDAAN